jgi:hypothetical protein
MKARLEDWIDPRHLSETAIAAAAARFAADPYQTVWFDNFLLEPKLEGLRALYEGDGVFGSWYGLYDRTNSAGLRFVDAEEFEAASDEQRFEQETQLTGAPPDRPLALGYIIHRQFLDFCGKEPLRRFLERITGYAPVGVNSFQSRITGPGHYVRPHDDNGVGRRLCLVFYPGRVWEPAHEGWFRQFHPDGSTRRLEPQPNRLVVFRVSKNSLHEVEPVAAAAPPRWGYTVWMGEPGSGA